MPASDDSMFSVTIETPEGSSLEYTRSKADQVDRVLRALPGVDYTYTTVGAGATGTVTNGSIFVKLTGVGERSMSQDEIMVVARNQLLPIFGVRTAVLVAGGVGEAQQPLLVNLRGPDVNELQRISTAIAAEMEQIPGVVDVNSSLGLPKPEYRINVNRDLANELELDIGQIANTVRPLLAGQTATTWEDPTGEERDVVIQVAQGQRTSIDNLASLPIATGQRGDDGAARTVPLGQIAQIEEGEAPAQIDRSDLERVATVGAGTTPELSISEASQLIQQRVNALDIPEGYSVTLGGETEQLLETMGYVVEAILLAVILIFLILASQFESITQPFAIMLSLPLSLIGVLLALLLTNDTLNMMSMIGVIMLMGLVTKNAILLVDNANERRALGVPRHQALVEAGRVRLRPIMMTTLAMIFGMLPIAMAMGEGGGFRAPMARAVIGGLITSTLLTLIVVPVAYTYFDDFGSWVRSKLVSKEREEAMREEQEHAGLAPEPVWGD
jgi:HAE1 family hydrophobic/amphiphilic exporter-1